MDTAKRPAAVSTIIVFDCSKIAQVLFLLSNETNPGEMGLDNLGPGQGQGRPTAGVMMFLLIVDIYG